MFAIGLFKLGLQRSVVVEAIALNRTRIVVAGALFRTLIVIVNALENEAVTGQITVQRFSNEWLIVIFLVY